MAEAREHSALGAQPLRRFFCATEAKLRAATGDTVAIRSFAPSCAHYADALDLPADGLKVRFGDMVEHLCKTSTQCGPCMGHLQKESEKPQREVRMRFAILTHGWAECANARRLVSDSRTMDDAETASDRPKRKLKEALMKRFKAKTLSFAQ